MDREFYNFDIIVYICKRFVKSSSAHMHGTDHVHRKSAARSNKEMRMR
jgi:hypothetical protein